MKSKLLTFGVLFISITTTPIFAFGGGSFKGAKEWTQISNKVLLGKQLSETANMYSKQIQEFRTQVEQFDLEKIMAEKFDTSIFDESLNIMDDLDGIFSLDAAKNDIFGVKTAQEMISSGNIGNSGGITKNSYISKLEEISGEKIQTLEKQSQVSQKRIESIEQDKNLIGELQNANNSSTGQMQATQVGNHINAEVLAQLVKMRQEAAVESQIEAQKEALSFEEEEAQKALIEIHRLQTSESVDATKARLNQGSY